MNILIVDQADRSNELIELLPANAQVEVVPNPEEASQRLTNFSIVFDMDFETEWHRIVTYSELEKATVIVSAVKLQLVGITSPDIDFHLVGMNMLPTFIGRDLKEITLLNPDQREEVLQTIASLNWEAEIVEDRVGMVSPRVIMMIINEACYTIQEGTASIEDIDMAMKLGTNYPMGPLEWADQIGIHNVYEVLEAMYRDTHDERYKICPLLKTKYLRNESFYPVNA